VQFAVLDGKRIEALPNGRANCPICGAEMVAKCGQRMINHWAHRGRRDCDPWWENETHWHREWKSLFPVYCREVSHIAANGEIHRADIKTPNGIVIEVQHSSMKDEERTSREEFYKNLVWIVDGSGFKHNFDLYHLLPAPGSQIAQDVVWSKARRHMDGANRGIFFRLSESLLEDPHVTKSTLRGWWYHFMHEIEDMVNQSYIGHHQYDWVRPRMTWLEANCPVYIDFGDDYLVRLEVYDESGLKCVRLISKRKFVHDAMTKTDAKAIATRFYPIQEK